MDRQTKVFNAFTGMSPVERSAVISFIEAHTDRADREEIREAVEYALKVRPSFGGFILTIWENNQIIGAVVANRTGMEGYNPKHLFVYVSLHQDYLDDEILARELITKATRQADGEIAMHIRPDNPSLKMYERLGFTTQYLELRLRKTATA